MRTETFDLFVLGAGPGGYVAAIRAAQLGLKTACVDENTALGGTCLRVGCIPSKALLESSERFWLTKQDIGIHGIKTGRVKLDLPTMMGRKEKVVQNLTRGIDSLFQKNKITRFLGRAVLEDASHATIQPVREEDEPVRIEFTNAIIATGSLSATLPGVEFDSQFIGTSTEAICYDQIPKKLAVIGAGYIGLELGSVWNRLGSTVHILEFLDRILPGMDSQLAAEAKRAMTKQGLQFHLGTRVQGVEIVDNLCHVHIANDKPVIADKVLVAVGRRPNTSGIGLEKAGVQLDEKGRIPVDRHFQTNVPGIYAVGDVIDTPMLAHVAEDEGIACAEAIATGRCHVNYDAIPAVCYTHPEIAAVGPTEDQLKERGVPYRKGTFSMRGNGRAHSLAETDGLVKILAHAETDRILAGHIIGPRAGELIAEIVTAIEFGASSEDLARTCHAHPTLAEAIKEAALAVDDRVIHA